MDADEVLRPCHARGQSGDREGRGIGAQHCVGIDVTLDLGKHLVLQLGVFEHRFDHNVDALEVGGVRDGGDPVEQRRGPLLGGQPPGECARLAALAIGSSFQRRLVGDVLEHHVDAGLGRHIGDAGAHHPGTDDPHLGRPALRNTFRPGVAALHGLQVEEERLDHVFGHLAG